MTTKQTRPAACALAVASLLLWAGCGGDSGDSFVAGDDHPGQVDGQGDGDGSCSCDITVNGVVKTLACGQESCINGSRMSCGVEAGVQNLGDCSSIDDGADGGTQDPPDAGPHDRPDGGSDGGPGDGGTPAADWKRLTLPTTAHLRAASVTSGTSTQRMLYLVGDSGTCYRRTASGFTNCGLTAAGATRLTSVNAGDGQQALVGGEGGALFKYVQEIGKPYAWERISHPATTDIHAVAAGPVYGYAFGDSGFGRVFYASFGTATPVALTGIPASASLRGAATEQFSLAGILSDEVWAVGSQGTIVHFSETTNSTQVQLENSGTTAQLNAVTVLRNVSKLGEVITVGNGGIILSRDPTTGTWSSQPSGVTDDLYAVAEGLSRLYAVGANGTVLSRPKMGGTWQKQRSGVTTALRGIAWRFVNPLSEMYVVGDNGTVLYRSDFAN